MFLMGFIHTLWIAAAGALAEFKAISSALPQNPEAANNKAVCLLYAGTLTDAVQVPRHP